MNHWAEVRQQWYESKSRALHETLHEFDAEHLKQRYEELKIRLRTQRRSWENLLQHIAGNTLPQTA